MYITVKRQPRIYKVLNLIKHQISGARSYQATYLTCVTRKKRLAFLVGWPGLITS
uniref:Uncharacterized protein n=1 Tax=Anguilla anguilla TaxID=7936 RepID=A0A0E9TWB7_ANGAN